MCYHQGRAIRSSKLHTAYCSSILPQTKEELQWRERATPEPHRGPDDPNSGKTDGGRPVILWADPGTGKQIQRSVYGATQQEVRKKLAQVTTALDCGDYFQPSKMTLARWVELWLQEYTSDKKYLTVKHYTAQCKTHIVPSLGAVKLAELTAPQIQAFYNGLLRDGMAPKSVRNIHGILTKCLSTAVSVEYIRDNPASRVTLPRVEKKEIHPLTDEQVKDFLRVSAGDEYETLLKVILFHRPAGNRRPLA